MKRYISFLFAALLLGTYCTDTRTDYMMGDTAYFPKSDLQKETLYVMNANDYVYNVWIHKAGYYQNRFAGRVELDYNYLFSIIQRTALITRCWMKSITRSNVISLSKPERMRQLCH